jgi:hypothetical protein
MTMLLVIILAVAASASPAKADELSSKEAELRAAQQSASELGARASRLRSETQRDEELDRAVTEFLRYHEGALVEFEKGLRRYRQLAAELGEAKAADQQELDEFARNLHAIYETVIAPGTDVQALLLGVGRVEKDLLDARICKTTRIHAKAREIAALVTLALLAPARAYERRASALTLPDTFADVREAALNAARWFREQAHRANQEALSLERATGTPEVCAPGERLRVLAGLRAMIVDARRADGTLAQLDVTGALAQITERQQAVQHAQTIRRFLLGMTDAFHARLADNDSSGAMRLADAAWPSINAVLSHIVANPAFDSTVQEDLQALARAVWSEIHAEAKSKLETADSLRSRLIIRATDLHVRARLIDRSVDPNRRQVWDDVKARLVERLGMSMTRPFQIPDLATREALYEYDVAVATFEADLKPFE